MLSAQIDVNGSLKISWPRYDPDIIKLGDAYLTYEGSLPPEQRLTLPTFAQLQVLYDAAHSAALTATTSETQRAVSAADLATWLAEAKRLLDDALKQLKGLYSKNLAQLEAYNLSTKVGARGDILVQRPTSDKGWVRFLNGYVAQQGTLPELNRIGDPAFAQLERLNRQITEALADRTSGRNQREIGVQNRSAAATRLIDHLQLAAFALVVTRFDGHVVNDLQNWGFNVVAKTAPDQPAAASGPLPDQPAV